MKISSLLISNEVTKEAIQETSFAKDVLVGLSSNPKQISAKYFYDDKGSALFQKITDHPEYYPTKTEIEILNGIKHKLPEVLGKEEIDIIELGAGDGHKSQIIIKGFLEKNVKVNYYPIDISEKAMKLLETTIKPHEKLNIHGIIGDYSKGLKFIREHSKNKKLVLFLGSNIGNFNLIESKSFLTNLRNELSYKDSILIGFDLKKDLNKLSSAYNDSDGLTKEFNLNLLKRINRELGGNFNTDTFQHRGIYNPNLGAMESFLFSTKDQSITISELKETIHFNEFEPLHLEYSFKYTKKDIDILSQHTRFKVMDHFTDSNQYFIDSLWTIEKENG
jgi:L-histidine Nalpha-methyltransferase